MNVIEYDKDFYILDSGKVRAFLIVGESRAILIDTCFKEDHIIEIVKKITNKPIEVILTHGDKDHIGGLYHFKKLCQANKL
ncbi:MAG: MBL fold metallo-hydrolase [Coprobacillus sp.]|nr:MBL fold metallo-hydrolase [Coprobacillus sp.]